MQSLSGCQGLGQTLEFDEFSVVLCGMLRVETKTGVIEVSAGQEIIRYEGNGFGTAHQGLIGAEYIEVGLPAFPPGTVHRDSA